MLGGVVRRLAVTAISVAIAGLPTASGAYATAPRGQANFSVAGLFPGYDPQVHDYVVRCNDAPVTVLMHASAPWQAAVDDHAFQSGNQSVVVPLRKGWAFTVTIHRPGSQELHRYYVRCLPSDFPTYTFTRSGPVSPQYVTADDAWGPIQHRYAMIFDGNGVPVWWYHTSAEGPRVLPDGTLLWFHSNGHSSRWEVHRLNGSLVRSLPTVGRVPVDSHDLQPLAGGGYVIAGHVRESHVNTTAFGGSADATVFNAELQEVGPQGNLLWDWKSQDHTSLAETGRSWPWVIDHPIGDAYDIAHWNSVEPHGRSVIASFRALDAVYKINKGSGNIVWKLGGTQTSKSLTVMDDPHTYPLGGQHDARLLPDGTLSVFDNRFALTDRTPRMVRYRIDQGTGTATLIGSISDPEVHTSFCCGSARRLANGDWLIDWGQETGGAGARGSIGRYTSDGERVFLLSFDSTFSYRAQPVPTGVLSRKDLRNAMTAMCSSGCG